MKTPPAHAEAPPPAPAATSSSQDRWVKYSFGSLRLAVLLAALLVAHPAVAAVVVQRLRVLFYVWCGLFGAIINTCAVPRSVFFVALAASAVACVADLALDGAAGVYLLKTTVGDVLAGKLDQWEWKLGGALVVGALVPLALYVVPGAVATYGRVTAVLAAVQLASEYGDAHFEHWVVFRHRYAFEVLTLAVLVLLPDATVPELTVVALDLTACLSYRVHNALLLCVPAGATLVVAPRMALFHVLGWLHGFRVTHVRDAADAVAVLKASHTKGKALEQRVACPAWAPVLSLESVDGPVWRALHADFLKVQRLVPPVQRLELVAARNVAQLRAAAAAAGRPIDANDLAKLTLSTFVEYLFDGVTWNDATHGVLVQASWEWRRALAMRGAADEAVKRRAIAVLVQQLLPGSRYWALFGDEWQQPRHYSLIMQPWLLSPTINTGDIMVAVASHPHLSLEDAVRQAHPFPILERFVAEPVTLPASGAVVPAHTQVIMFPDEWRASPLKWPVFAAGRRSCLGATHARAWLKVLHARLCGDPLFRPALHHRYSGRNNDGRTTVREAAYGVWAIASALLRTPPAVTL